MTERLNIVVLREKEASMFTLLNAVKRYLKSNSLMDSYKSGITQEDTTHLWKECLFVVNNVEVHLSNTPAIAKRFYNTWNIETIRRNISNLSGINVHEIIILLKFNNIKFLDLLKTCIKEIECQLGRAACKNISFVFINNNACNNEVLNLLPILKGLIQKMELTDMISGEDTVFCIDDDKMNILTSSEISMSDADLQKHFITLKFSSMKRMFESMLARKLQATHTHELHFKQHQELSCERNNECYPPMTDEHGAGISSEDPIAPKELNILLLGETGVGKSTFINGLANYFTFDTFTKAICADPVYVIATQFKTYVDDYDDERTISIGEHKGNEEDCITGNSGTQRPKSYSFITEDKKFKLCFIDTPGIGDTRGKDQDKINFEYTMCHLSHLKELHGICILLKPNQTRLSDSFTFCFQELLLHLHKDACKNIAFVFTNARGTYFKAGDTVAVLKEIIAVNTLTNELKICKYTLYYLDNEAVRYLAEEHAGILHNAQERIGYQQSWERSCAESQRLLLYFSKIRPHFTETTVSLNNISRLIVCLAKPLAQVAENIQENIFILQEKNKELQNLRDMGQNLKVNLNVEKIILESRKVSQPRLICRSSTCCETVTVGDTPVQVYKQICHENCYLKYASGLLGNINAMLMFCEVFDNGICTVCKCPRECHQRVTYDIVKIKTIDVDLGIKEKLESNTATCKATENFIIKINEDIKNLKNERDKLIIIGSKCEVFIQKNSLVVNEDILKYSLENLIKEREEMRKGGQKSEVVIELENILKQYNGQTQNLKCSGLNQTPSELFTDVSELFKLPINGSTIKQILETVESANRQIARNEEVVFKIRSSLHRFSNLFTTL